MTPSTSKATVLIAGVAALGLAALFGVALWRLSVKEGEVSALVAQNEERAAEEEAFQSLRALQASAKGDLEAFDKAAFSEDKLVSAIESLERAGRAVGAQVTVASVDKTTAEKGGKPGFLLVVVAEGPWKGVYQALAAAESLPYKFSVEGADLSRQDGAWQARLTLFFPTFD